MEARGSSLGVSWRLSYPVGGGFDTGAFREQGQHRTTLDADLVQVLMVLAEDAALNAKYCDHELSGIGVGIGSAT